MKKALIVTAFARFVKSFLTNDILILQSMGYEVHCAANIHHAGAECMDEYFKENYPNFMDDERYLIKPNFSNHYKIMVNTRYGNSEYPIKIYVYE